MSVLKQANISVGGDVSTSYLSTADVTASVLINFTGVSTDAIEGKIKVYVVPTAGIERRSLINGDYLRGNSLRMDLDYATATSEIKVFKAVVNSEISQI